MKLIVCFSYTNSITHLARINFRNATKTLMIVVELFTGYPVNDLL